MSAVEAEEGEGVRILYACESGSRAWDFASWDSDWDLRLRINGRQDMRIFCAT